MKNFKKKLEDLFEDTITESYSSMFNLINSTMPKLLNMFIAGKPNLPRANEKIVAVTGMENGEDGWIITAENSAKYFISLNGDVYYADRKNEGQWTQISKG